MQVFQRQMSKEGLQAVVNGSDAAGGGWSSEMLRDLFTLRQDTASDTYDSRCRPDDDAAMEADDESAPPLAPPQHRLQARTGFSCVCRAECLHPDLFCLCLAMCLRLLQLKKCNNSNTSLFGTVHKTSVAAF